MTRSNGARPQQPCGEPNREHLENRTENSQLSNVSKSRIDREYIMERDPNNNGELFSQLEDAVSCSEPRGGLCYLDAACMYSQQGSDVQSAEAAMQSLSDWQLVYMLAGVQLSGLRPGGCMAGPTSVRAESERVCVAPRGCAIQAAHAMPIKISQEGLKRIALGVSILKLMFQLNRECR